MSHQQTTERPPDAETVRQWYEEGWIDDDGLDELLETAIETYGGEGRREEPDGLERAAMLQAKAETQRVSAPPEAVEGDVTTAWLQGKTDQEVAPAGSRLTDIRFAIGFLFGVWVMLMAFGAFPDAVAGLFGWEIVTERYDMVPL